MTVPGFGIWRFSPACAGNGQVRATRVRAVAVQPRVCGERVSVPAGTFGWDGSAPRVRGTGPRVF